jgi:hypothetical protein
VPYLFTTFETAFEFAENAGRDVFAMTKTKAMNCAISSPNAEAVKEGHRCSGGRD